MNVKQIIDFGSCGKALAWAVVEQAIIDFRETNSQVERETILEFLCDFLPNDTYIKIRSALQ